MKRKERKSEDYSLESARGKEISGDKRLQAEGKKNAEESGVSGGEGDCGGDESGCSGGGDGQDPTMLASTHL